MFILSTVASCKKDLAVAIKGDPQIILEVSLPQTMDTSIALVSEDSSVIVLTAEWTKAEYLTNSSIGNIGLRYQLQIDVNDTFTKPYKIDFTTKRDTSFSTYNLNSILMELGCVPETSNNVFIQVLCISSVDTILSNTFSFSAIPYSIIVEPKITVPDALFITGDVVPGGWVTPFPDTQKFTKIDGTTFSLTTQLLGGKSYELVTDINGINWTPCFHVNPSDDPSDLIYGGNFIEDGDGTTYNWSGKLFLSPPDNGIYKLTFNFQTAVFTVEKQ